MFGEKKRKQQRILSYQMDMVDQFAGQIQDIKSYITELLVTHHELSDHKLILKCIAIQNLVERSHYYSLIWSNVLLDKDLQSRYDIIKESFSNMCDMFRSFKKTKHYQDAYNLVYDIVAVKESDTPEDTTE